MSDVTGSSGTLLRELPVSPPHLCYQRTLDPVTDTVAESYLANVLMGELELNGDSRHHTPNLRGAGELCLDGCKIHGGNPLSGESPSYLSADNFVKEKMRERVTSDVRPELARRLSRFRKDRGLTQAALAERFGVRQSAIARWEKGTDRPSTRALLSISEMVSENEKQWWRDQAAEQTGISADAANTFGLFGGITEGVTIPLISNPKKVGSLATIPTADIESNFLLPHSWFLEGGAIQATRVNATSISSLIDGDVIALIDASQKDPDRLVGCAVAVRTVEGIEVRKLQRDQKTYFLLPLHEGHGSVSLWRPSGENSIVGKVVRWISQPGETKR